MSIIWRGQQGGCLKCLGKASGKCLEGVPKLSGRCTENVWKLSRAKTDAHNFLTQNYIGTVLSFGPKIIWDTQGFFLTKIIDPKLL